MAFQLDIDPTYKVPRYLATIIFSAGVISASSSPLYVLYVGMKTSAGSMVADTDVLEVTSQDQVDALAGARSQLAQMARAGIAAAPTSRHFIAACAEPSGTKANATVTLGGSWSTTGEWAIEIAGTRLTGTIAATDTADAIVADMKAKFDARTKLPVTAGNATNVLTVTAANNGAQGRDHILRFDKTKLPAGMTVTLAGSANLGGNRVRLGASGSGTGVEDVSNIIAKLKTARYARIAVAQSDSATNAPLWEAHLNDLAGPTKLILEHVIVAHNGDVDAAKALSMVGNSAYNHPRVQVLWHQNGDIHPSVVAAVNAAIRASREGTDPVPDYDGLVLPGIPPHAYDGDNPADSDVNVALNSGLTPVVTVNGQARVARAITSYCRLDANTPDTRTLDIGDAVYPDYLLDDLRFLYLTQFRPSNKYVGPNPAPGEDPPPAGVGYPDLWTNAAMARLGQHFRNGWIRDPALNPIVSTFNEAADAIESTIPVVVRRVQHQMRNVIRQTAP